MTDVMLIDNILTSSDKQDIQFADAQWLYMNDNNNMGYSNYIQFLTTTLKNQFIDYHNAYFFIPITMYITPSINFGYAPRPPMVCYRESVLSLFANITIATDQGQVIVNDVNTMFINNVRLCVEHNAEWANSEGALLCFAYDRFQVAPNRFGLAPNVAYPWNPTGSILISPGYQAPQGTLMDAQNFSPITNDPNTQGQYMLATSSILGVVAGMINTVPQNVPFATPPTNSTNILVPGTTASTNVASYIPLYCANGRIAYLHYTYSGDGTSVTSMLEIGGINLITGNTTSATGAGATYWPGYGSGINKLLPTTGANQTGLIYMEATATVANFPVMQTNAGAISTANLTNAPVPLSFYGGTVMVPILLFVNGAGGVTVVQLGGLNLWTGYSSSTAGTAVTNTALGPIQGSVLVGAESPQANIGFKQRVTHFQNQANYDYGVFQGAPVSTNVHRYSFNAQVPLKLIHDFFMQLDIPIINVGWNIQLFLAQAQGPFASSQFPPFMTSNNTQLQLGGLDDTPAPSIQYGSFKGTGTACRLYYRVVKFQPQDNSEMAKKLTAGFTKSFTFISTDWIIPQGGPIAVGNTTTQIYLSQSIVHPLRLWVLGYANNVGYTPTPAGGSTSPLTAAQSALAPVGSFIQSSVYSPGVLQGFFDNVNVQVNNLPYFRQNFQNSKDLFEQLREQFNPDQGCMISYEDFTNYKRYLCFDLTRISDRIQSPTEPVSLIFQGNRNDGLNVKLELYFLAERKNQATMRFSAADVSIVVGNLD